MAFCLRCADRGLLALRRIDGAAELDLFLVEVEAVDELLDRVGAHAAFEVVAAAVLELTPEHLVLDDLAGEQVLELVPGTRRAGRARLVPLADRGEVLSAALLAGLDLGVLGAFASRAGDLRLELLVAAGELELALLLDGLASRRSARPRGSGGRRGGVSSSTHVTRLAAK